MPRDVFGNYTLPAGNPVVTATVIASSWANTTLNDIATALTNSLSVDGSVTARKLKGLTAWAGTAGQVSLDASGNFTVGGSGAATPWVTVPNITTGLNGWGTLILKYCSVGNVGFLSVNISQSSGTPGQININISSYLPVGFKPLAGGLIRSQDQIIRFSPSLAYYPSYCELSGGTSSNVTLTQTFATSTAALGGAGGYGCLYLFTYPINPAL